MMLLASKWFKWLKSLLLRFPLSQVTVKQAVFDEFRFVFETKRCMDYFENLTVR